MLLKSLVQLLLCCISVSYGETAARAMQNGPGLEAVATFGSRLFVSSLWTVVEQEETIDDAAWKQIATFKRPPLTAIIRTNLAFSPHQTTEHHFM